MNIICPLFPGNPSEANLLLTAYCGEPYLDYALRRLSREESVRLNILTNHKCLHQHLVDEGYNTFWTDEDDRPTPDYDLFSHFKLPRLKKRLGDMSLDDTNELVLLDIRFPLITFSVLHKALVQYRHSMKATLVSVSQPVDHPVQIETFFSHVGTDILSTIDTGFDIDRFVDDAEARYGLRYPASIFSGICFSKPFFFNWDGYSIQPGINNSLIYRVYDEGPYSWAKPYSGVNCMECFAVQSDCKYYLFESINQARRLYSSIELETESGDNVTGGSFSKSLVACSCLLVGRKDTASAKIFLQAGYIGNNYLMRVESVVASKGKKSPNYVLIDIDRHIAQTPVLEIFGTRFHELELRFHQLIPADHWIVTILQNVVCGTADISQPILLENASWYTDPCSHRKFDTTTKEELTGRQLFPELYCLDGAFLIAEKSYILAGEFGIDYNDVEGFALSNPISRKILSEIDFWRFISS